MIHDVLMTDSDCLCLVSKFEHFVPPSLKTVWIWGHHRYNMGAPNCSVFPVDLYVVVANWL